MNTRSRAMQQQKQRVTFAPTTRAARAPAPPVATLQVCFSNRVHILAVPDLRA